MYVQSLTGAWEVRQYADPADGSPDFEALFPGADDNVLPAEVPGSIHIDLLRAGRIPDPYFADNSLQCGWVTETDWCYCRDFTVEAADVRTHMVLEFDGIDTFADIYLNNRLLGSTQDMFKRYTLDATAAIRPGVNRLAVVIRSIKKRMDTYPTAGYFGCFNVPRIFIRKAQCHFSWDWAPNFPATGIWEDVRLVGYDTCRVASHQIFTRCDGTLSMLYEMEASTFDEEASVKRRAEWTVTGNGASYTSIHELTTQKGFFHLQVDNPRLWWPADMGEPFLYDYALRYYEDDVLVDEKEGRLGIREIGFDESPRPQTGGFHCNFLVNGRPVFLKGANWVPLDIMTGSIPEEKYRKAIGMAKQAHFNCLRVWGGGIYEKDIFYRLCDEEGILVWQDFAFACSDVPDDYPGFAPLVISELEYQMKRLRNHPSIFVWCGGNEKTGSIGKEKSRGDVLIYYTARGIAGHLDPTRPFFPCSPWGRGDNGNLQDSGDSHCNSYQGSMVAGGQESFREHLAEFTASLASEIAVQGCPPLESLRRYIPEDRLWPMNELWDLHFACNPYDGTGTTFAQQQLQAADLLFGKSEGLQDFAKKSMAVHCLFVKADSEYHRSRKGDCGGALFWMYSDIWPCGTWALVDYYLLPKPAYYAAKASFRPFLPIITRHRDGLQAVVVNDTLTDRTGTVTIRVRTFEGEPLYEKRFDSIRAAACAVTPIVSLADAPLRTDSYMAIDFSDDAGCVTNLYRDPLWKDAPLPDPGLSWRIASVHTGGLEVVLQTERYARMVFLHLNGQESCVYDDNYFDMEPGETRTVRILCPPGTDPASLRVCTWLDQWDD